MSHIHVIAIGRMSDIVRNSMTDYLLWRLRLSCCILLSFTLFFVTPLFGPITPRIVCLWCFLVSSYTSLDHSPVLLPCSLTVMRQVSKLVKLLSKVLDFYQSIDSFNLKESDRSFAKHAQFAGCVSIPGMIHQDTFVIWAKLGQLFKKTVSTIVCKGKYGS